jgi:hypothetical protein
MAYRIPLTNKGRIYSNGSCEDPDLHLRATMNAGLQKLLSLGASLTIGPGPGRLARLHGSAGIPRFAVVVHPPAVPSLRPAFVPAPGFPAGDSRVKEVPRETFGFLLDEEFDDPPAAAWWQRNRHRFDRNPIRVE